MPKKPPPPPPEDPVDVDRFEELDADELPDELELHDLEPVFTEEAPPPLLDSEDDAGDDLPALAEDKALGVEPPIDLGDEEEDDELLFEDTVLADEVDWESITEDVPGLLPMLHWSQEVFVEELGRTLPAELDPTAESTTWYRPDVTRSAHRLTFQLGNEIVSSFPSLVRSRRERLRIGRDVLSGRFLVRC